MAKKSSSRMLYVALGDSLTNGVGANGNGFAQQLVQILEPHTPIKLLTWATNGQTSTQLMQKRSKFIEDCKHADLITILIGGNDLRLTWNLFGHKLVHKSLQRKRMQLAIQTLANNWNELAKTLKEHASPKTRILFINLYNPYQTKFPQTGVFVEEANRLLQTICANYGLEVIDARGILNTETKKNLQTRGLLLAKDGVHLSELGYRVLANAVYKKIYPESIWSKLRRLFKFQSTEN